MMAESSEKAVIECVVEKFNVKMSRMYIVEIKTIAPTTQLES
jgi:hypothetical protein